MGGVRRAAGWSVEERARFFAALARAGTVKLACEAIGRSAANAYDLRKRDAAFAAEWARVVAEVKAARVRALPPPPATGLLPGYRVRHDGWTERRQRVFLRALAETGSVRDACGRARISNTSAYRMRRRSAAFDRAWARALAKAAPTIEQAAFERAVEGWEEPILHGGRIVAYRRRFSDALLRLLLQRGIAEAPPAPAAPQRATRDETDAVILRKLGALEARLKREARAQAIAWADEMAARGLAP